MPSAAGGGAGGGAGSHLLPTAATDNPLPVTLTGEQEVTRSCFLQQTFGHGNQAGTGMAGHHANVLTQKLLQQRAFPVRGSASGNARGRPSLITKWRL